jgi:hypothetical protein
VATVPSDATSGEELIGQADAALYRAKAAGKNRVEAFSDERREFARYDADLKGSLRALDEVAVPLKTANVSQGGFMFTTTRAYPVGSLLQLDLGLPRQKRPLACTGRIVRVMEREFVHEVGARIIHFESEDLYRFRRYISNLSKKRPANRAKEHSVKAGQDQ